MMHIRFRWQLALSALACAFIFIAADYADARGRTSGGSRGTRTQSAPPPTATAPKAAPIQRTMTPTNPSANFASRPGLQSSPAAGLMSRPGFMGGMFMGLLGAGLIGLMLGGGLTGGLAGLASFLGLALQVGIIALIGWLLFTWWQRRNQPATAAGPSLRTLDNGGQQPQRHAYGLGGALGGGSAGGGTASAGYGAGSYGAAQRPSDPDEIGTTPADFEAFERLLTEIQTAYGQEDITAMRARMTPEMLSYFMEEMNANASRGVINQITDVKLLQGDPAEAWREGNTEYCTVAMRYSLNDLMVDRTSGKTLEGGPDEAVEVWTFMRVSNGNWILSAIQQTD